MCLTILGLVNVTDASRFQRFIGLTNPLIVFAAMSALSAALFILLQVRGWFSIFKPDSWGGIWKYFIVALLFGFNAIVIDLWIVFPADINVPFPASLSFYPAIDFIAQVLFHVLPLSLLIPILNWKLKNLSQDELILGLVPVVPLIEPVYQAFFMHELGTYSPVATGVVGVHVYLINLLELWVFKRYDFIAMYLFRLAFYTVWHVAWGHARLALLF